MKKLFLIIFFCFLCGFAFDTDAATTLYLRKVYLTQVGDGADIKRALSIGRGEAIYTATKATFVGDNAEGPYNSTSQQTDSTGNNKTQMWVSNPLASDVTISGTITFNIWAQESATQANACITADLVRLNSSGVVQSVIATGGRSAELTASSVAQNWTRTPASTTVYAGERIGVRVYIDDGTGVTMAGSRTVTITINGLTGAANGDSYVTFTEDLTFNEDTITTTVKSSGGDFASPSNWESTQQANLVTNKWISQAELYSMSDTTGLALIGWTTDATHYVKVYTPLSERHNGTWDATKFRFTMTGTAITVNNAGLNVELDGLQIQVTTGSNGVYGIYFQAGNQLKISNTIIRAVLSGTATTDYGVDFAATNGTLYLWNSPIYDWINGTYDNAALYATSGTKSLYAYNNTFVNSYTGAKNSTTGGTQVGVNNLFQSCTTAATGTWEAPTDYNATDISSMGYTVTGGGNTHDRLSQTFTFNNESGDDFRLLTTDAGAREYGVSDPGSGLFSDDITGDARPIGTSWDIGADEANISPASPNKGRFFLLFP